MGLWVHEWERIPPPQQRFIIPSVVNQYTTYNGVDDHISIGKNLYRTRLPIANDFSRFGQAPRKKGSLPNQNITQQWNVIIGWQVIKSLDIAKENPFKLFESASWRPFDHSGLYASA